MTRMIKSLVAISLSVMMALTLFPLIGGVAFSQTAFADDEIVQDDGAVGVDEVQDDSVVEVPSKDDDDPDDPDDPGMEDPDDPIEDGTVHVVPQWSDPDYEWELYADGNRDFDVYCDEAGMDVQVRVGLDLEEPDGEDGDGDGDDDEFTVADWEASFTGGLLLSPSDYEYGDGVVTLKGASIYDKIKGTNHKVYLSAAIVIEDEFVAEETDNEINVHGIIPEYPYLEDYYNDTELFPKERLDDLYKNDFDGYVENSAHPEGYWFDCTVTKVSSSNSGIAKVTENTKKHYWRVTAVKQGEATITVSFKGYKKAATTWKFKVKVVGERVTIGDVYPVDGEWRGLPGESVELRAEAWYETVDGEESNKNIAFEWRVLEECAEFGEIIVDPDDSSKATLTFLDNGDLEEYAEYGCDVDFEVTATYTKQTGDTLSATQTIYGPQLQIEYNRFDPVEPVPQYLDKGQEFVLTPRIEKCSYDLEDHQRIYDYIDVQEYEFDVDTPKGMSVTDNNNGTFTIKRITNAANGIYMTALWDYDPDEEYYNGEYSTDFYFNAINTNLSNYYIKYVGEGIEESKCYVGPEGIDPEIQVVDWDSGYVLPEGAYTLVIKKVTWDDLGNETSVDWTPPFIYDYDPADPWAFDSGYGNYKVYAKAAADSGFKGNTDKEDGWLDVYSDHTLHIDASTVEANGDKYDPYMVTNDRFEPGTRYDLPFGFDVKASDFTVKAKGGTTEALEPGIDYTIKYSPWFHYDGDEPPMLDDFPTTAGVYDCCVVGIGDYYGKNFRICFFVGEKNPAQITTKTKTVKYKKLKKKAQKTTAITVTDAVGPAWFYKTSGSSKLSVSEKTGKITVKKKTKKGTYKANVTVLIDGDETYAPVIERVQVTIKVK